MARPLWKGSIAFGLVNILWSCTWLSAITGLDSGCSMPRTVHPSTSRASAQRRGVPSRGLTGQGI